MNNSHLRSTNVRKRGRPLKNKSEPVNVTSSKTSEDESYIIKLLGRKVNLTSYDADAPLYSLCRAWVQDESNNEKSVLSNSHAANDDQNPWKCNISNSTNEQLKTEEIFRNNYVDASDNDDNETVELPPGIPLPPGVHSLRIPSPIAFPKQEIDLNYERKHLPSKEQLLEENSVRWRSVRQKWKLAAAKNESRYRSSKTMLNQMMNEHADISRMMKTIILKEN